MIILGKKYKFTKDEIDYLKNKYEDIINIPYNNIDTDQVIETIEKALKSKNRKIIILNTSAPIPDKLITYLTNLELKGMFFISIEHFPEKHMTEANV